MTITILVRNVRSRHADSWGLQISYEAGDHVAVYAENSAQTVAAAGQCLGLSLDTVFRLSLPDEGSQQLSAPFAGGHTY